MISAPGLGDDIQAMKSGLLEIADMLVVNKGDREGAERTLQQLVGALSIRATAKDKVPVLKTTATTGKAWRNWSAPSIASARASWPRASPFDAAAAPAT